jgi:hypothetical protein
MEVLPPVELDSVTINVAGGFLSRVGLSPTISVPVNSLPGKQLPLFPGEKVQFTALLWKDGIVVGCSEGGDCDGYPQASIRMPYHDLYQAYLKSNGGDKLAALREGGNDG